MQAVADYWERGDTDAGLASFTEDAVYMQPPDVQLFFGHEQLRPYFAAVAPGTIMRWHHLWFDEASQTGVGEFTFGEAPDPTADHGVAIVALREGRIAHWREYVQKGPSDRDTFLATEGKTWRWHIGNFH